MQKSNNTNERKKAAAAQLTADVKWSMCANWKWNATHAVKKKDTREQTNERKIIEKKHTHTKWKN